MTDLNVQIAKQADPPTEEKLVTLHGSNWGQFKTIEAQLTHNREVRLTYLARVMEICLPLETMKTMRNKYLAQ